MIKLLFSQYFFLIRKNQRFHLFELTLTLVFKGSTLKIERGSPDYALIEPVLDHASKIFVITCVTVSGTGLKFR